MAVTKFTCPPQEATATGSFSDNLVGFQIVDGGGLTQGNFAFTVNSSEKQDRNFSIGVFSAPINLESLGVDDIRQSKQLFKNNFEVYPNFDLTIVTNFVSYGSLSKRFSSSITNIISFFPAAIECNFLGSDYSTGTTASNIIYDAPSNETSLTLAVERLRNPFEIDFTTNSTRNLSLREIPVSGLRNFTTGFTNYSLFIAGVGYSITRMTPTESLSNGNLVIYIEGDAFSGQTETFENLIIRPNDLIVNKVFNEDLDEVENFLLNRKVSPIYTATFKIPSITDDGQYYLNQTTVNWPLFGNWNIDIISSDFTTYLQQLEDIASEFDSYKTNIISRFLTTGAFKEFDTSDQKVEKVLQIYGRSFDETSKFISALAYMNSVNYNVGNDIPSQLLKNLSTTLGWSSNFSPISNEKLLNSVFGQKNTDSSQFSGVPTKTTPDELNYQFYRNVILNSAYLFKSKGTRKSIEMLMRLIGAPDSLVEINEYVYVADQRININQFNTQYASISGGTLITELPILEDGNTFKISGVTYTGYTTQLSFEDTNVTSDFYPIDLDGFPKNPAFTDSFFYQIGSGWYQQTPQHRAPESINLTTTTFTGNNPNYQTTLLPFNYGEVYLSRYRSFPYMNLGFNLVSKIDNNKSWTDTEVGARVNLDGNINAFYYTSSDKLVLNVKNTDIFLNPSQGILYDVWNMSRIYDFPIPNRGLDYIQPTYCNPDPDSNYPKKGGVDWTVINPQPKEKTFFEFAQTFWLNTINVRNRLFSYDGKTSGYPTLQSIYWRYIQSKQEAGIDSNNFNYDNMIKYVEGIGSYWIKLVEQMIPSSTIWNTGVRYENSIFHRQKYAWRRQMGCQLIPIPCRPCSQLVPIYNTDCPIQVVSCSKYPWGANLNFSDFSGPLLQIWNNLLTSSGILQSNVQLNTLQTKWYIVLYVDGTALVSVPFFEGNHLFLGMGVSIPFGSANGVTSVEYDAALATALLTLDDNYGYGSYSINSDTIGVYNSVCGTNDSEMDFKLKIEINFSFVETIV